MVQYAQRAMSSTPEEIFKCYRHLVCKRNRNGLLIRSIVFLLINSTMVAPHIPTLFNHQPTVRTTTCHTLTCLQPALHRTELRGHHPSHNGHQTVTCNHQCLFLLLFWLHNCQWLRNNIIVLSACASYLEV